MLLDLRMKFRKNIDIKGIFSKISEKMQSDRGIVVPNKIIRARELLRAVSLVNFHYIIFSLFYKNVYDSIIIDSM